MRFLDQNTYVLSSTFIRQRKILDFLKSLMDSNVVSITIQCGFSSVEYSDCYGSEGLSPTRPYSHRNVQVIVLHFFHESSS